MTLSWWNPREIINKIFIYYTIRHSRNYRNLPVRHRRRRLVPGPPPPPPPPPCTCRSSSNNRNNSISSSNNPILWSTWPWELWTSSCEWESTLWGSLRRSVQPRTAPSNRTHRISPASWRRSAQCWRSWFLGTGKCKHKRLVGNPTPAILRGSTGSDSRTGPAGHRESPGGQVAINKYYLYINKLMFFGKRSIMLAGQTKFPRPFWQTSPTLMVDWWILEFWIIHQYSSALRPFHFAIKSIRKTSYGAKINATDKTLDL